MSRFSPISLVVGCILFAAGCDRGPKLVPATGTVTLDGKPQVDVIVNFEPVGAGRPAVGRPDASGNFQLMTDGKSGARAGEYRVSVIPPAGTTREDDTRPLKKSPIPARYQSPRESKLSYTVAAGEKNHFDIRLTSAAPR